MLPPPQFDHQPNIPVIEHVLTSDRIDAICQARHALGPDGRAPPPGYRFTGCAHVTGRSCEVWRIDDGTVRRHELGHCAGWPADHPAEVKQATPLPAAASTPAVAAAQSAPWPAVVRSLPGARITVLEVRPAESPKPEVLPLPVPPTMVRALPLTGPAPWPVRDAHRGVADGEQALRDALAARPEAPSRFDAISDAIMKTMGRP